MVLSFNDLLVGHTATVVVARRLPGSFKFHCLPHFILTLLVCSFSLDVPLYKSLCSPMTSIDTPPFSPPGSIAWAMWAVSFLFLFSSIVKTENKAKKNVEGTTGATMCYSLSPCIWLELKLSSRGDLANVTCDSKAWIIVCAGLKQFMCHLWIIGLMAH